MELSDYHDADVAAYQTCFGTNVTLTRIPVDGGAGQTNGEGEVEGDIEAIAGLAPSLGTLLVYDAPDTSADHLNVYQRIANDDRAPVVSNSWGVCEQIQKANNPAFIPGANIVLQQMAAQGQSFFTAGGDSGSTACMRADPTNHTLSGGDSSAQPYATVVGGTHLSINGDATYASEHAWNTMNSGIGSGAGGGGFSSVWPRPAWQTGPGTTNTYSNGMRETPDVAAVAEVQWTFFISGSWSASGGTSFAAPLWAAGMILIDQYLVGHGALHVGFANPALYAILNNAMRYASAFHDVTTGNNCFDRSAQSQCVIGGTPTKYQAVAAYDDATGIGSPDLKNLAVTLATTAVTPTVTGVSPASGSVAGGISVAISGTLFQTGATVTIGGAPATNVTVVSSETITATTPPHTTPGPVSVTVTNPNAPPGTLANAYTYIGPNPLPALRPDNGGGHPASLPHGRPSAPAQGGPPNPLPPRRP